MDSEPRENQIRFCVTCKDLPLYRYFHHEIERPRTLRPWQAIKNTKYCPFCCLVVACIGQLYQHPRENDIIELSNEKCWIQCATSLNFDGLGARNLSNEQDLKSAARQDGSQDLYQLLLGWNGCRVEGQIQRLEDGSHRYGRALYGHRVSQQQIDWARVRGWMETCERWHQNLCDQAGAVSRHLPKNLRMIDLKTKRVEQVDHLAPPCYVALTYVWGSDSVQEKWKSSWLNRRNLLRHGNGRGYAELPERLPPTIRDAILVANHLKFRYLWVDALCIVQEPESDSDKENQTSQMDAIYNSAFLTIAVGSSPDSDCGIPGVGTTYRHHPQITCQIDGLALAVCFPSLSYLYNSKELAWNKRGWTFQEKLLSSRLLLFTDWQVYFKCSEACWWEDCNCEYGPLQESLSRQPALLRWPPERAKPIPQPWKVHNWEKIINIITLGIFAPPTSNQIADNAYFTAYTEVVKEFTSRTLGRPDDVLKAIMGVLRTLDRRRHALDESTGMPSFGPNLAKALLWQPRPDKTMKERLLHKVAVPSWSWARWEFQDGCHWNLDGVDDSFTPYMVLECKGRIVPDTGFKS